MTGHSARGTGPALEATYRFIVWLIPAVQKFPRAQEFLLGDHIQATALDALERLIEATYTREHEARLASANLAIEKLRFLFRVAPSASCGAARGTTTRAGARFGSLSRAACALLITSRGGL